MIDATLRRKFNRAITVLKFHCGIFCVLILTIRQHKEERWLKETGGETVLRILYQW